MTFLSTARSVPAAGVAAAALLLSLGATAPAQSGGFDSPNRPNGENGWRVPGRAGNVIRQNPVSPGWGWDSAGTPLIRQKQESPVVGTVSVARLRHKVPSRARKEFEKALAAEHKGDSQAATAHFEKAVQIDPAFFEACNNLGVCHLLVKQFEQAIAQFRWALTLDGTAALVYANLGIAYLSMDRFPEAEKTARQGLKYDSTSNRLHLVLGVALEAERREHREALENLAAAAREFPRVRLVVARMLARDGERSRAAVELKKYLRSDRAGDRQQVETWLAKLER